jgi:hypothetical protein
MVGSSSGYDCESAYPGDLFAFVSNFLLVNQLVDFGALKDDAPRGWTGVHVSVFLGRQNHYRLGDEPYIYTHFKGTPRKTNIDEDYSSVREVLAVFGMLESDDPHLNFS